jgi:hypothetical protein
LYRYVSATTAIDAATECTSPPHRDLDTNTGELDSASTLPAQHLPLLSTNHNQ